jgi:hypothetical protein
MVQPLSLHKAETKALLPHHSRSHSSHHGSAAADSDDDAGEADYS